MALSVTAGMTSAGPMEASADRVAGLLGSLAESVDASLAGAVAELQERWAQARLRVLLVGEAKRGKSTVGNAILRRQVLPAGVVPLTAVATTVRAGTPERIESSPMIQRIETTPARLGPPAVFMGGLAVPGTGRRG